MEKTTPPIFSKKDIFFQKFATSGDVLRTFHPDNWGLLLKEQKKCLTAPKASLVEISEHYGEETAKELVKQQFFGLLRLCSTKETNTRGAEEAADIFLSLYGHQITPYGLMLYFALYPTKYKDTYREFDTQDILKQCGKFVEWWAAQQPEEEQQQASNEPGGYEAFLLYAAEQTPEKLRGSSTYRIGLSQMTERAIKELTSQEAF